MELIEGEVIVKVTPQLMPHAINSFLQTECAWLFYGRLPRARTDADSNRGTRSQPEPDVAVITGGLRAITSDAHPTTAILLIEVSGHDIAV